MRLNIENKNFQLTILACGFILWFINLGKACSCGKQKKQNSEDCYRFEIWGVQPNHFYLFAFLGYFYPEYFYLIQTVGILWEIFEHLLERYPKWGFKLGGCLDNKPKKDNWHNRHLIYKGKEKYYNPLDRLFGIKNSKVHGWHGSAAEIIVNIIGFGFGYYLQKLRK